MLESHMNPEEALQSATDVGARVKPLAFILEPLIFPTNPSQNHPDVS